MPGSVPRGRDRLDPGSDLGVAVELAPAQAVAHVVLAAVEHLGSRTLVGEAELGSLDRHLDPGVGKVTKAATVVDVEVGDGGAGEILGREAVIGEALQQRVAVGVELGQVLTEHRVGGDVAVGPRIAAGLQQPPARRRVGEHADQRQPQPVFRAAFERDPFRCRLPAEGEAEEAVADRGAHRAGTSRIVRGSSESTSSPSSVITIVSIAQASNFDSGSTSTVS